MSLRRLIAPSLLVLVAASFASAQPAPQPDIGRQVAFCNQLFAETGYQRNQQADNAAKIAAQLDMANNDVKALEAQVAQLQAENEALKKVPAKAAPTPEPPKK